MILSLQGMNLIDFLKLRLAHEFKKVLQFKEGARAQPPLGPRPLLKYEGCTQSHHVVWLHCAYIHFAGLNIDIIKWKKEVK